MKNILNQRMLHCIEPENNHNKFYEVTLAEEEEEYRVITRNGRIGTNGRTLSKYNGPSMETAEEIMDKVCLQKLKKYKEIEISS